MYPSAFTDIDAKVITGRTSQSDISASAKTNKYFL